MGLTRKNQIPSTFESGIMNQKTQVRVPDIGDFEDVEIIEVHINPGDTIETESPLITLESDKATMDVPAPFAGRVESVLIKVGDKVSEGTPIVDLQTTETADSSTIDSERESGLKSTETLETQQVSEKKNPSQKSPEIQTNPGSSSNGNPVSKEPQLMLMPDMGDFTEVDVIEVLVQEGDLVQHEDSVITLESDKATMDVPSPLKGTIQQMLVSAGQKISKGQKIALILPESDDSSQPVASEPIVKMDSSPSDVLKKPVLEEKSTSGRRPPISEPVDQQQFLKAHASPSVRKFARDLGVDLSRVTGSGRKGRITHDDVQKHVKQRLSSPSQSQVLGGGVPPIAELDFSQFGEVEIIPLSRIRKKGAEHLHRAWLNLPMVTNHDEADITELEAFRQKLKKEAADQNIRLTMLAFLLKATSTNLKKHPDFRSSLSSDGQNLIHKRYCHIGVAVDTDEGLVVPVIQDVDQKGVYELAQDLGNISEKARKRKLKREDLQGGCFSISSLGGIGGTAFTPLVNAPEVAILGVTRSKMTPQWNGEEFIPRLMLPLDLTYDHRVIDGAAAARFLTDFCLLLADMKRLLL